MRIRFVLALLIGSIALKAQSRPTIYIAGDATAKDEDNRGWAIPFVELFDVAAVQIENRAEDGASARSFLASGAWHKILENLKAGDFVLIQFGHSDGGSVGEHNAADLPGTGNEPKRFPYVKDGVKKEIAVHSYGWYLRRFVEDVKARGGHPILMSPTVRDIWKNGQVEHEFGGYAKWAREVAESEGVPFVDAGRLMADRYQEMGPRKARAMFTAGVLRVHPSLEGSALNAAAIVSGLRALPGAPLDPFLSDKGRAIAPASIKQDVQ